MGTAEGVAVALVDAVVTRRGDSIERREARGRRTDQVLQTHAHQRRAPGPGWPREVGKNWAGLVSCQHLRSQHGSVEFEPVVVLE